MRTHRPYRIFQGCQIRPEGPLPTGPVGWEEVEEWERSAEGGAAAGGNYAAHPAAQEADEVRCTPWRNREELLAVRDLLYARHEDDGTRAKKRRLGFSTVGIPFRSIVSHSRG
jgi:hypothetical protein